MNGEQFKALEVKEQVNYINELLKKGYTVDNIRLTLGIGKNYIGNTFKANGYIKDNISKLYILDTKNTCTTSNTYNTDNTDNTDNTYNTSTTCNTNYKYQDIKALENRLNSLEKEFEKLKSIVNSNTSTTCNTFTTDTTNNTFNTNTTCNSKEIIKYKPSNLVSRNYKIDKEVLEQFVEFCKVNKLKYNHNVSDLITNAIVEYMNKNK